MPAGAATAVRSGRGDLLRLRVLLVVLGLLGGARQAVRRGDGRPARARPRLPRHRGGQQRRVPAAALPGRRDPGRRGGAGRQHRGGGARQGHPHRGAVPGGGHRRRGGRAVRASRPGRGQQRVRTRDRHPRLHRGPGRPGQADRPGHPGAPAPAAADRAPPVRHHLPRALPVPHAAEPLRHPVGPAGVHGGPQPVQAGQVPAWHAHPDPPPGPHRGRPSGLRARPALEPADRADRTAVLRRGLGWAPGLPDPPTGGGPAVKVVLFCGGLGMRMREGAASAPKPMNMIGDRPLLWHVMRYYAHFGHTDFILCLGYGAAAVKDYFIRYDETLSNDFTLVAGGRDIQMHSTDITDWNISFIDTGLRSSIGERLMRVRSLVEDEEMFLANYADTLTDARLDQLIDRFRSNPQAVASMLAVPPVSTHHVVEIDEEGQVSGVREVRELMQWENGGY